MNLKNKYGNTALVAGASEGIGAAFTSYLAKEGLDLVLVARRLEPLEKFAKTIRDQYQVKVLCIDCDLSSINATEQIMDRLEGKEINMLVYNAALSYIGPYLGNSLSHHHDLAIANMVTPIHLLHALGNSMVKNGKGAVIQMASLAGFQGSGFLSAYGASKAFNRVLAEGLWYEWKDKGVDVIACCAGATSTPNFLNTQPEKSSMFAPKVQTPEEVVNECFKKLGKVPSFVTGSGNKFASFIMQKLMPRKMAIQIMGDTTRKMYRIK
jgi:hypothetical protein